MSEETGTAEASAERAWTAENVAEAGPWQEFYKVLPTRMRRMDGPFTVQTREGVLRCEDGWLALDEHGDPYPIAADVHASAYQDAVAADNERLRTLFTERVAAQFAARRCAETLLSFQNVLGAAMADLSPILNAAMTAMPDPQSTQARASITEIDRLAKFFLNEHPELISGDRSPVDVAINSIKTLTGAPGTPVTEMLRAVRDNLVIHSTQSDRVGWSAPHESLRRHGFRYLAQNAVKPWSEVERGALIEALNAGLIAIDHTRVVLTNSGRAALGLVPLDGPTDDPDADPINPDLAEPGKLG